jgi:hypothetical protein
MVLRLEGEKIHAFRQKKDKKEEKDREKEK